MPLILGRSETQYVAMVTKKLNSERLTVRLGLTVIYFPIFRQGRPAFFRECLHLRKDVTVYCKQPR